MTFEAKLECVVSDSECDAGELAVSPDHTYKHQTLCKYAVILCECADASLKLGRAISLHIRRAAG